MKKKHLPRYLVLENVKFFERSESCKQLLDALSSGIQFSKYSRFHENFFFNVIFVSLISSRGFIYRQFLVSPTDLGIPNQRARYFLIAKRGKSMKFHFDSYVKNWKRKDQSEPAAKKQRIEPKVEEPTPDDIDMFSEPEKKSLNESPKTQDDNEDNEKEEVTNDEKEKIEARLIDNDSDSEDVIQERLRSASTEEGKIFFSLFEIILRKMSI